METCQKKVFKQIAISWGKPSINLFGSSINEQLSNNIYWTWDPWTENFDLFCVNQQPYNKGPQCSFNFKGPAIIEGQRLEEECAYFEVKRIIHMTFYEFVIFNE